MRTTGYQSMTTKIVAIVALFSIIVAFSVVIVMRANESITPYEYIWFKVEPNYIGLDTTGDVAVYAEDGSLLERILLLNITEWQSSGSHYDLSIYVRIYVSFWYLEDKVSNVMYLIGRSPIGISLDNITLTIVSAGERPTF